MEARRHDPRPDRARRGAGGRLLRWALLALLICAALLALAWGAMALSIDGPGWIAGDAFVLAELGLLWPARRSWLARGACAALFLAVLGWWLALEPSNDRKWLPEVAHLPVSRVEGGHLVFSNVRNFEYRSDTDVTPHWEERSYDLAGLLGVDLFLCDWGAAGIVHTILSWEFADGQHLAISIETRKEEGEAYSAVKGFFRRYELYYAVADERDVIGVRAQLRGERLRLYRLAVAPDVARALLLSYAARIDRLLDEPAWYNALSANCTTTIRLHTQELGVARPWDWRLLANGHIDELLYERGAIDTALPFAELRAKSDVTQAAIENGGAPDFAERIRSGLPARPAPR